MGLACGAGGRETLSWTGTKDGRPITFDSEPYAGFWKKLTANLLRAAADRLDAVAGPSAESRQGTNERNRYAAKITRCTAPCIMLVRPVPRVIAPTRKLSVSITIPVGSRPSVMGM